MTKMIVSCPVLEVTLYWCRGLSASITRMAIPAVVSYTLAVGFDHAGQAFLEKQNSIAISKAIAPHLIVEVSVIELLGPLVI